MLDAALGRRWAADGVDARSRVIAMTRHIHDADGHNDQKGEGQDDGFAFKPTTPPTYTADRCFRFGHAIKRLDQ